jgi:hypothetical protein
MGETVLFIGIDYSGAETARARLPGLQVYAAGPDGIPRRQKPPPTSAASKAINWSRSEVAQWLTGLALEDTRFIAGIDHNFSFPDSYFARYGLRDWPQFLTDFVDHWPTDQDGIHVDSVRDGSLAKRGGPRPGTRIGASNEFRLCERWTSSAKSVFQFDVQGQVAKSSHAGIPWLKRIRDEAGEHIHFWPFDGWAPASGKSVIAEVYPSVLRRRFKAEDRSPDEHDAYSVARWLAQSDADGILERYFSPPLTPDERAVADREGWILGVT